MLIEIPLTRNSAESCDNNGYYCSYRELQLLLCRVGLSRLKFFLPPLPITLLIITHAHPHIHTMYICIHTHARMLSLLSLFLSYTHTLIHTHRLSVDRNGRVVFNHERADSWNINHHLQSLQKQEGLTPRGIYWRIWGLVNWLRCERCGCYFQCSELPLCAYHPQPIMIKPNHSGEHVTSPLHSCCERPLRGFSTLPYVKVQSLYCAVWLWDYVVSGLGCTGNKDTWFLGIFSSKLMRG